LVTAALSKLQVRHDATDGALMLLPVSMHNPLLLSCQWVVDVPCFCFLKHGCQSCTGHMLWLACLQPRPWHTCSLTILLVTPHHPGPHWPQGGRSNGSSAGRGAEHGACGQAEGRAQHRSAPGQWGCTAGNCAAADSGAARTGGGAAGTVWFPTQ
jgi:hypothetical protein